MAGRLDCAAIADANAIIEERQNEHPLQERLLLNTQIKAFLATGIFGSGNGNVCLEI